MFWMGSTLWGENEGDDETVECEGLSENQYQNHSYEDFILLCIGSDTCVADDTDSETCSLKLDINLPMNWIHNTVLMPNEHMQRLPCIQLRELFYYSSFTFLHDNDGDDHTVNTENTSHDDGYDGLHDEFGLENTHRADTDACFGASVGGTEVGENEGRCDTDVSEEVVVRILDNAHWTFEISDSIIIY